MLSYEPEIARLAAEGAIRPAAADLLTAIERRERFSIHWELRTVAYVAVMMITAGVGIYVKEHYDEIGPLALILAIALAAAGCYGWMIRRTILRRPDSSAAEYVLLLGSLLLSADVAFAETQYHLLGGAWPRHFLLLAVVHAAAAYWFRSRIVLSVAITSLAAWFGVEQNVETFFDSTAETGTRAMSCAAAVLAWRFVHRKFSSRDEFLAVFDHAMTNLAMWGALVWCFDATLRWPGIALLAVFAWLALRRAFALREEVFAFYAGIYFYVGASAVIVRILTDLFPGEGGMMLGFLFFLVSIPAMVWYLFSLHQRFRRTP